MENEDFSVKFTNCNNISNATILLQKNKLNIKYGLNGTGKSTMARAIELTVGKSDISILKPFGETTNPEVELSNEIKTVMLFNEDFVNNIVFKESEVIQNSFEVFIKTQEYDIRMEAINKRLKELKLNIVDNEDVKAFHRTMSDVLSKLIVAKTNELKQTPFVKAIVAKENIYRVPQGLLHYQPLFSRPDAFDWVDWKTKGFNYDDTGICPFCTDTLKDTYAKEKENFSTNFNKTSVKSIIDLIQIFEALSEYMNNEKRDVLHKCIKESTDEENIQFNMKKFRVEIDYLKTRIQDVIEFDSYKLAGEDISSISSKLTSLKLDMTGIDIFNSKKTIFLVEIINKNIEGVLSVADELKTEMGKLKGFIEACIQSATRDINGFMESSGINYRIEIHHDSENTSSAILKYVASSENKIDVDKIRLHLSWGERNAFALALFMYYSISRNPDLIILDDPISSFDSSKKYAIMNRLFTKTSSRKSFTNRTILLLTHDFQPIIDFVVNDMPHGNNISAHFLQNLKGFIHETEIIKNDIKAFPILLSLNAKDSTKNIIHRIICLRKYLEYTGQSPEDEIAYNIISCILHGKKEPDCKMSNQECRDYSHAEYALGEAVIRDYVHDFSYSNFVAENISIPQLLINFKNESNRYYKIQIFRVIIEIAHVREKIKDDTIIKYIDEQFHIENDYIFYLDFDKYDIVPEYYIEKCLSFLSECKLI